MSQTIHDTATQKKKVSRKEEKTTLPPAEAALPATPQTLLSDHEPPTAMDSDDDMQSVLSGSDDGFGEDQDSSVDFDAGMCGNGFCIVQAEANIA